jgi:hypothetical protein
MFRRHTPVPSMCALAFLFLLLAALLTCWVRSEFVGDLFSWVREWQQDGQHYTHHVRVWPESGRFLVSINRLTDPVNSPDPIGRDLLTSLPTTENAHWEYSYTRLRSMRCRFNVFGKDSIFGQAVYSVGLAYTPQPQGFDLIIPFWLLTGITILFALVPTRSLLRRVKRNRLLATGLCPKCSYDLRSHTSGEKCPECGSSIPPASGSSGAKPHATAE